MSSSAVVTVWSGVRRLAEGDPMSGAPLSVRLADEALVSSAVFGMVTKEKWARSKGVVANCLLSRNDESRDVFFFLDGQGAPAKLASISH